MKLIDVLFLDDRPEERDGFNALLAATKCFRVRLEKNFDDTLDFVASYKPDVIVLDLNLQYAVRGGGQEEYRRGHELAWAIRDNHPDLNDVPILITSRKWGLEGFPELPEFARVNSPRGIFAIDKRDWGDGVVASGSSPRVLIGAGLVAKIAYVLHNWPLR